MSKAFLLFAGLIVISLTALGTWGIIHISKKIKQNTTAQKPVNQLNTQPRQTTGMENFVPSTEITDTAYQLIISYLTAGTLEEKSQFVRNSDRVRPLMTNWYSRVENFGKEKAINVKQFGHVRMLRNETNHLLFVEAAVDEDFRRKFFALVSPIEKVDYKIDWEVTEGYQPIPLDEFKKIRPIEPVTMRLHLTNGNYYNYAFNDETRYRCYELTFPGTDFQIYGYVERDSDIDEQIIATAKTANTQNFMLDVAFPPSLLSNDQVEIRALVHENWFP